jgi:hypothetical protein
LGILRRIGAVGQKPGKDPEPATPVLGCRTTPSKQAAWTDHERLSQDPCPRCFHSGPFGTLVVGDSAHAVFVEPRP